MGKQAQFDLLMLTFAMILTFWLLQGTIDKEGDFFSGFFSLVK